MLFDEWVSDIFEQIIDRPIDYKVRTYDYKGTGTYKLQLRHRPVYPLVPPVKVGNNQPFTPLSVIVQEGAYFGEAAGGFTNTPLTLGTNYAIKIDQDDGGSREAILYSINDAWPIGWARQQGLLSTFKVEDLGSIQVTSTAGYTIDTLPGSLRAAADLLIARLSYIFPLGMQLTSESYIERSIGLSENQRRYLLGMARPLVLPFKNWHW